MSPRAALAIVVEPESPELYSIGAVFAVAVQPRMDCLLFRLNPVSADTVPRVIV